MEKSHLTFRQEIVLVLVSTAAGLAIVAAQWWTLQPPPVREQIRGETARWLHRVTAARARRQAQIAQVEEIVTGRRSLRYLSALGLGLLRDLAVGELERMKP